MAELISKENQDRLDKLRRSGKYCCINISSDFHYVWEISLIEWNESESEDSQHRPIFAMTSECLDTLIEHAWDFDNSSSDSGK